ncbi:replication-associated protein [Circoviridae 15 LDMD-2013]|uniref:replication-associated protein n=1 Tax=Circoviridae 15 LDMD-2013 TaxID=1379719 RepID=UPI0003844E42|nr:replication-associated protein [Circoviridae 15 LDMD-2013]AGS36225.1 replication-associated protein [Circoviridae 15 LDMD-2013]
MSRLRNVCFTLYNADPEDVASKLSELVDNQDSWLRYAIFQEEKCPESDRLHLQGYLECTKPVRFGTLKDFLGSTVHLERRRGNRQQARDYCRKEETRVRGPWECGDWNANKQGQRTDLDAIREMVVAGATEESIADEYFGTWARNHRAIARYKFLKSKPRDFKPRVIIRWGVAGSGKTRGVYDTHETAVVYNVPRPNGGTVWFDGYDPSVHEVVLLDDFYGWLPWSMLLQMLDRYPMSVPKKGSTCNFRAKFIYITSNADPETWYDYSKPGIEFEALKRRVDETHHFTTL